MTQPVSTRTPRVHRIAQGDPVAARLRAEQIGPHLFEKYLPLSGPALAAADIDPDLGEELARPEVSGVAP
ncbi:hypothetical protein [Nocardia sp. R7R-8]|uniref:hypothetical protein n=1 Tax=Nocardia sp. R7R-8 TaxID=3459304 RepID=UPI00403D7EE3